MATTREKSLAEIYDRRDGYYLLLLSVFRPDLVRKMNKSTGRKAQRYGAGKEART